MIDQTDERARSAITQLELTTLVTDSWTEIDLRHGADVGRFFTEDAVFDIGPAQYTGRRGIEAEFRSRIERGPRTARHVLTNLRVHFLAPERAEVHAYLVLYASDGEPPLPLQSPASVGELVDTLVCDESGQWLIESRRFAAAFLSESNPSPFMRAAEPV
jgi:hypothetical protein